MDHRPDLQVGISLMLLLYTYVAPRQQVGLLDSALSHLALGCGSKHDFVAAIARGLGGNMATDMRRDFLADLTRWVCGGREGRYNLGITSGCMVAMWGGRRAGCHAAA